MINVLVKHRLNKLCNRFNEIFAYGLQTSQRVKLNKLKPDLQPKFFKPRLPHTINDKVETEINRLVDLEHFIVGKL